MVEEKKQSKARIIIGVILITIILFTLLFLILNSDVAFTNNATIKYPDGCVEQYVNGELISLPCSEEVLPYNEFNFNPK